jgi:hypothetical protein
MNNIVFFFKIILFLFVINLTRLDSNVNVLESSKHLWISIFCLFYLLKVDLRYNLVYMVFLINLIPLAFYRTLEQIKCEKK